MHTVFIFNISFDFGAFFPINLLYLDYLMEKLEGKYIFHNIFSF